MPLAQCLANQVDSDLPFRLVPYVVGNAGLATAGHIVVPTFRQVQLAVEHATERIVRIVVSIEKVNADNAIIDFPRFAAVLPLNTGCLYSLFGVAGSIDNADRILAAVLVGDEMLIQFVDTIVIPPKLGQKLLERPHSHAGRQRDGLDVLTRQGIHQPQQIRLEVSKRRALKTFTKISQ